MTPWQKERLRVAMQATVDRPASWQAWWEAARYSITTGCPWTEDRAKRLQTDFAAEAARTLVGVVEEVLLSAATEHVVVTGVPRAGKTTFANAMGGEGAADVLHTDDLIGVQLDAGPLDWSGVSQHVADFWLEPNARGILLFVEGVAAVRALRKWLAAHPEGKPCDRVLWFGEPKVALTPGQAALAQGCWTVWREIRAELVVRGVVVEVRS